jgi:hypothetical protein
MTPEFYPPRIAPPERQGGDKSEQRMRYMEPLSFGWR